MKPGHKKKKHGFYFKLVKLTKNERGAKKNEILYKIEFRSEICQKINYNDLKHRLRTRNPYFPFGVAKALHKLVPIRMHNLYRLHVGGWTLIFS